MKKVLTVFILALSLLVSLVPAGVFAAAAETSLEADLGGYHGNNCMLQAGKSKDVQFCVGEDDGSDLSFDTKIPATKEDFAVYDDAGEKTADVELMPLEDGKMRITPSSSISTKTIFEIRYVGSEYEFSAGNYFTLTVMASDSANKAIRNSSVSDLTAASDKNGIRISFEEIKNVDEYKIYRSTKKSSGYKLIANVCRNRFIDGASLKKGTRYYYKVRGYAENSGEAVYSKYSSVASAKARVSMGKATAKSVTAAHINSHDKSMLREAYIFGVSNKIKFRYNATKKADVLNNLQYAFLIGDYELGFAYKSKAKARAAGNMILDLLCDKEYDSVYADLFCAYNNAVLESKVTREHGMYCVYISVKNASLTDEEIFSNQKKAVAEIKKIAAELRENGKIKSGMSQKEIAEVYYEYISGIEADYFSGNETVLSKGLCMQEDTPYAFLFERRASCLGHTATYNQFLHYEGIRAYGVANWFGNVEDENGHIISYVVCDGEEYFADTTNNIPLTDQEGIEKHLIFRGGSLERVRAVAGK